MFAFIGSILGKELLIPKWILKVIPFVIVAVIASLGTYKVTKNNYEVKLVKSNSQVELLLDVNRHNVDTIGHLRNEINNLSKSYQNRINSKDKLIRGLKEIDELKGGPNEKGDSDILIDKFNDIFRGLQPGNS